MHLVTIPDGISEPVPVFGGRNLEGGKSYICTNAFAGQLLFSRWRVVIKDEMWSLRLLMKVRPITFFPFNPSQDWNDRNIWLYRGGGYGDLLMLTPLIREMKIRWPKCQIHVACGKGNQCIFHGMDVITESIPIPEEIRDEIDALIDFEEIVEGDPKAERFHMAQLFADRANIVIENLKPEYHVTEGEKEWAEFHYPRNLLPRIGVQLLASAFYRTHPDMGRIMTSLSDKADVYIFGSPGQVQVTNANPTLHNLMADKLTFRQSAAVAATCDVCVSPDSALVHLCSALDVPCVALYGPFPSELRVTSDKCFAFDGKAYCAPCFFHAEAPDQFPAGMPCTEKKRCVALESIDPDLVVEKVLSLAGQALESPG